MSNKENVFQESSYGSSLFCYIIWTLRRIMRMRKSTEETIKLQASMMAGFTYGLFLLLVMIWLDYFLLFKYLKQIWLYECMVLFPFAFISFIGYEKHAMKRYDLISERFEDINTFKRVVFDVVIIVSILGLPILLAFSGKYISVNM